MQPPAIPQPGATPQPPAGAWVPPVTPWPTLYSSPTCTLAAPLPADVFVAALAEEFRRRSLWVSVRADGRSVKVKPALPIVATIVGLAVGGGDVSGARLTVTVESESPERTELRVLCEGGGLSVFARRVAKALNAFAWRLAQNGVVLTATPWERYSRFRRDRA